MFFVCVSLINASAESQHCESACLCVAPLTLVKAAGGLALNAECFTAARTRIHTHMHTHAHAGGIYRIS